MSELALVQRQTQDIDTMTLGDILASSGYFKDARDASQAIVKILAGRELGFGPIAAMTGVHIIQGRPSLSANLMAAAIKNGGKYNYRVKTLTNKECSIEFFECGESVGVSTFTEADAKLAGTQNMNKYPRNMLFARAMSNGAKWFCPDVFGGPVYTPDEMGAVVDWETGEVVDLGTKVEPEQAPVDDSEDGKPRKSWTSNTIDEVMKLGYAKHPKHAIAAMNLSNVIGPTDEIDVVCAWVTDYAEAREAGAESQEAAEIADRKTESRLSVDEWIAEHAGEIPEVPVPTLEVEFEDAPEVEY